MRRIGVTLAQIDDMKHALGFNCPDRRDGNRIFVRRNFFGISRRSTSWDDLVNKGLAAGPALSPICPGEYIYKVTKKGVDLLSEISGMKILTSDFTIETANEGLSPAELLPVAAHHDFRDPND